MYLLTYFLSSKSFYCVLKTFSNQHKILRTPSILLILNLLHSLTSVFHEKMMLCHRVTSIFNQHSNLMHTIPEPEKNCRIASIEKVQSSKKQVQQCLQWVNAALRVHPNKASKSCKCRRLFFSCCLCVRISTKLAGKLAG